MIIINLFRAGHVASGHSMSLAWDVIGWIFSNDTNTNTNY